jgi:hypothetical protein
MLRNLFSSVPRAVKEGEAVMFAETGLIGNLLILIASLIVLGKAIIEQHRR